VAIEPVRIDLSNPDDIRFPLYASIFWDALATILLETPPGRKGNCAGAQRAGKNAPEMAARNCAECLDSRWAPPYIPPVSTQRWRVLTAKSHLRHFGTLKTQGAISMAFTPLHDRVLVRRIEGEEKTKGGLIIPDSAKEKPAEGEVVAVGAGARDEDGKRIAMDVKVGDKILFGKWSGTEVTLDGKELLIMKESDILGLL